MVVPFEIILVKPSGFQVQLLYSINSPLSSPTTKKNSAKAGKIKVFSTFAGIKRKKKGKTAL
jgi:hypothetical protein